MLCIVNFNPFIFICIKQNVSFYFRRNRYEKNEKSYEKENNQKKDYLSCVEDEDIETEEKVSDEDHYDDALY